MREGPGAELGAQRSHGGKSRARRAISFLRERHSLRDSHLPPQRGGHGTASCRHGAQSYLTLCPGTKIDFIPDLISRETHNVNKEKEMNC